MRATEALQRTASSPRPSPMVLANPPYHDDRRSTAAESPLKAVSHQMPEEALDAWARFMCRMAAPGGRAAMIHKAEALPRILSAFEGRFGAIGVLPIYARAGEPAIRVIVERHQGQPRAAFRSSPASFCTAPSRISCRRSRLSSARRGPSRQSGG